MSLFATIYILRYISYDNPSSSIVRPCTRRRHADGTQTTRRRHASGVKRAGGRAATVWPCVRVSWGQGNKLVVAEDDDGGHFTPIDREENAVVRAMPAPDDSRERPGAGERPGHAQGLIGQYSIRMPNDRRHPPRNHKKPRPLPEDAAFTREKTALRLELRMQTHARDSLGLAARRAIGAVHAVDLRVAARACALIHAEHVHARALRKRVVDDRRDLMRVVVIHDVVALHVHIRRARAQRRREVVVRADRAFVDRAAVVRVVHRREQRVRDPVAEAEMAADAPVAHAHIALTRHDVLEVRVRGIHAPVLLRVVQREALAVARADRTRHVAEAVHRARAEAVVDRRRVLHRVVDRFTGHAVPVERAGRVARQRELRERARAEVVEVAREFGRIVAREVQRVRHEVVLVTERELAEALVAQTHDRRPAEQALVRHEAAVVDLELVGQLEECLQTAAEVFSALQAPEIRAVHAVVHLEVVMAALVAHVSDAGVHHAVQRDAALCERRSGARQPRQRDHDFFVLLIVCHSPSLLIERRVLFSVYRCCIRQPPRLMAGRWVRPRGRGLSDWCEKRRLFCYVRRSAMLRRPPPAR
ncbi:hypothetical protein PT2222_80334 [Paraburkholderia tropica]